MMDFYSICVSKHDIDRACESTFFHLYSIGLFPKLTVYYLQSLYNPWLLRARVWNLVHQVGLVY